jgi:hypothetical protein
MAPSNFLMGARFQAHSNAKPPSSLASCYNGTSSIAPPPHPPTHATPHLPKNVCVRTYSKTRNTLSALLPVTTRLRATMLGWRQVCRTRSSRTEVTGMPARGGGGRGGGS